MKNVFILLFLMLSASLTCAQKVGIGTITPVAKLDIIGVAANPTFPGPTSTGIIRVGPSNLESIDIGKLATSPFSGWIQAGYGGDFPDPLSIQPLGGNVGVGTVNPVAKININGTAAAPSIPGTMSTGIVRIAVSANEAIDIGKMIASPFSGWIQSGLNGSAQPLSLQPSGGNLGIGMTNPTNKLSVQGNADFSGNVGVGITTPPAKMSIMGIGASPSIPGSSSSGIVRIGISSDNSAIDVGKMSTVPYSGWIQSGTDGNFADPLSLQPSGGNVGIGNISPVAKLDIRNTGSAPTIPGASSTGGLRISVGSVDGIDIGKMNSVPFAGWIQSGYGGSFPDPISLQPLGGSVGIGVTSPATSAALDVNSTSKGFLPPRMTYAQRNAITGLVAGLIIYCTDCDEIQFYNGTIWKNLDGSTATPPSAPYITICNQDWMIKNLDVSTYRNGDPILKVTNAASWSILTVGAYCYYNNDSATYAAVYGKLYNWYAVHDPRGLAPAGWRVPTNEEFNTLTGCLGGSEFAGGKMKETGTSHWISPNTGATNSSFFTGLPGGQRHYLTGAFGNIGAVGNWWSSTADSPDNAWQRNLVNYNGEMGYLIDPKTFGYSVRCVRD